MQGRSQVTDRGEHACIVDIAVSFFLVAKFYTDLLKAKDNTMDMVRADIARLKALNERLNKKVCVACPQTGVVMKLS